MSMLKDLLIRTVEKKSPDIHIKTGREAGMRAFDQGIYDLIQSELLSEEQGVLHATNRGLSG